MPIEDSNRDTNGESLSGSALIRLLTWMSPAFPLGTFTYSHGLETAISEGIIHDRASTHAWINALLERGGGWSDAILLAQSWHAAGKDIGAIRELNDLALAMAPAAERYLETTQQGTAFLKASKAWPVALHDELDRSGIEAIALPVILGAMARQHNIPLDAILPASLHAFGSNLISVAMRLVPLGQSDGLALQAVLEPTLLHCAKQARKATLKDIGTSCLLSDIAAMRHENLTTRIFRS